MRKRAASIFLIAGILLTGFKLWLVAQQPMLVIPASDYDDRLFVKLANSILDGLWLGPYDQFTLIKGPFYPIWIAAAHTLRIPLLLSQHLLYVVACAVFVAAVRRTSRHCAAMFLLYVVLLFQPMSYTVQTMERVVREGIYPSLVLLALAGAVGLCLRQDQSVGKQLFWAATFGLSLGASWITREEGVWIVPSLAICAAWALFALWGGGIRRWRGSVAMWGLSAWLAMLPNLVVSSLNYAHYDLFAKTEFDSREFKAAYGALARVKPAVRIPNVPVTREMRYRIYRVSPTFSELMGHMEGGVSQWWAKAGPKGQTTRGEVLGGWFMWALRESVSRAGAYDSGRFPATFYQRLADEVNTACAEKRLDCDAERVTMAPILRNADLMPVIDGIYRAVKGLITFENFDPQAAPSPVDHPVTTFFRQVTREDIYDPAVGVARLQILSWIGGTYQWITPYMVALALLGYTCEAVRLLRHRRHVARWAIATTLLAASGARVVVLAILEFTWSFPALDPFYMSPIYPLMTAAIGLNVIWGLEPLMRAVQRRV